MSSCFKTLEDRNLSTDELIEDVKKEKWNCYYYMQDIENTNHNSQYVLARGQFCFDSIEFNTIWRDAIQLYNKNDHEGHFLSIGGNVDGNDNQVSYIHKEKTLNTVTDSIGAIYKVHFVSTNQIVWFGATKE